MLKFLQNQIPNSTWIVKDTNKNIFKKAAPVTLPLTEKDLNTMQKMIDWVNASQDKEFNKDKIITEAVGIAASQIGENVAMYYISAPEIDKNNNDLIHYHRYAMINPKIIAKSETLITLKGEGCLSVDKTHEGYVPRSYKIIVSGYDFLQQKTITLTFRGYEAIIFQHEQDHLEGKLYYHHINKNNPFFLPEKCEVI